MYFQTGQVIFVPEWPKGEFVSIVIGLILFGQNHLYVKMLFNRDSAIQKCFRRFYTACKSEDFRFPVSRPDDGAIPSGRSSVHCCIHPDDVPYRSNAQIDLASFVRTT